MPTEHRPEMKFEIEHALLIDIVVYPKVLINEHSEQIQKLKQIVRGTEQFHETGITAEAGATELQIIR
jgi:hypothetical protein